MSQRGPYDPMRLAKFGSGGDFMRVVALTWTEGDGGTNGDGSTYPNWAYHLPDKYIGENGRGVAVSPHFDYGAGPGQYTKGDEGIILKIKGGKWMLLLTNSKLGTKVCGT